MAAVDMAARLPESVEVGSRVLPFDGTTLCFMHEAPARSQGPHAMRAALARDGYLLLRNAVPPELVDAGCASIVAEVAKQGWLVEGTDPADLIVKASPPGGGSEYPPPPPYQLISRHACMC